MNGQRLDDRGQVDVIFLDFANPLTWFLTIDYFVKLSFMEYEANYINGSKTSSPLAVNEW